MIGNCYNKFPYFLSKKISGEIKVNGEVVDSLSKYRKVTGFVPQEDIMHRKLTVEEVLMFQGRLRLPGSTPAEKIKERVVEIMTLLEIAHVAKVQIGDEVQLCYQYNRYSDH